MAGVWSVWQEGACVTAVGPHPGEGLWRCRWLSSAGLVVVVAVSLLAVDPAAGAADTLTLSRLSLVAGRHGCFAARASSRCLVLPVLRPEGSRHCALGRPLGCYGPDGNRHCADRRTRRPRGCYDIPDVAVTVTPDGRYVYVVSN